MIQGRFEHSPRAATFYRLFGKRLLDLMSSASLLLLLFPLLVIVTLAVRFSLGSPVIFRQQRVGLKGKVFDLLKFRSMTDRRNWQGNLLPDEMRLTGLGRLLRGLSLDELPELINVLRGEMSLVGPRPLLTAYLPRYTPEEARRHEVKPGISGWAQVNGRNALTWEERFRLDVWYVDHQSVWIDLKILALTAWKVAKREGISEEGHATMSEFFGRERERSRCP